MHFASASIHNFRNLTEAKLTPANKFNLLYGSNGSGKTSVLEALYYLCLGKSFRTHLNARVINHQAEYLSLFANICEPENKTILPVGVQRHQNGEVKIRLNQESAKSMLEVARLLPVLVLNAESQDLLTGSSKLRRRFLDWGVFHVEPSFLSVWQQTERALKQRNAALKSPKNRGLISFWDKELDATAEKLNHKRHNYLKALEPIILDVLSIFFDGQFDFSFKYKAGWDEEIGLMSTLHRSIERDIQLGHTQHGPHRTDILMRVDKYIPVYDVLSQGQQKLLVYALHLAQGILLKEQLKRNCIYLLDDLPAELDINNRFRVAKALDKIDAQVFITGVDTEALSSVTGFPETNMFHVEHGRITNQV